MGRTERCLVQGSEHRFQVPINEFQKSRERHEQIPFLSHHYVENSKNCCSRFDRSCGADDLRDGPTRLCLRIPQGSWHLPQQHGVAAGQADHDLGMGSSRNRGGSFAGRTIGEGESGGRQGQMGSRVRCPACQQRIADTHGQSRRHHRRHGEHLDRRYLGYERPEQHGLRIARRLPSRV